jgi:L-serine/L-threonine ammonia-lyase
MLGQEATVVVPETTTEEMKLKIRAAGGRVLTHGASWNEADEYVRALLAEDPAGVYCSPFDNPDIWAGNATVVDEIVEEIGELDALVVSVGGGGLFCGLQLGLIDHEMEHVPIVAVEPEGAASLKAALQAGELVTIPAITSIAKSLGVKRVAQRALELGSLPNVRSVVLSDAHAAMACCRLMDDERIAVEPACGISAAAIYYKTLKKLLPELTPESKVVIIVCGGEN